MASGTLSMDRLNETMALTDPESITTGTHWVAWQLAHGYALNSEALVSLGFSVAITHLTISTLTKAGWQFDRTSEKGRGQPITYRAVQRPDGSRVRARSDDDKPPTPLALSTHKRTQQNGDTKARKALAKAAHKAAGKELAIPEQPAEPPIDPKRLAMLRPSPVAPPLGAPMRVMMVAETNGHATMALQDEHGRTWFAHLDEEAHG